MSSKPHERPFPIEPLLEAAGRLEGGLGRAVNASGAAAKKALEEGCTLSEATRWAHKLGLDPADIWPGEVFGEPAVPQALPDLRDGWQDDAACADHDTSTFFPDTADHDAAVPALRVCWVCPVRSECLADALSWPSTVDFGIRGGFTEEERQAMRRQRRPPSGHPGHGSVEGYMWERRHGRETCQACRDAEARYRWALQQVVLPDDDPRHGTPRGYRLGCRDETCPAEVSCRDAEKARQERYKQGRNGRRANEDWELREPLSRSHGHSRHPQGVRYLPT